MVKSDGKSRIDAITVVEITLASRVTVPGAGVEARYVLQNSKSGDRFGSGTFTAWSDETATKFNELLKLMEKDICSAVFEQGTTSGGTDEELPQLEDEVPGL